jgi:hypothetical protein
MDHQRRRRLGSGHALIDTCPNCIAEKRKQQSLVFWDGQLPLTISRAEITTIGC